MKNNVRLTFALALINLVAVWMQSRRLKRFALALLFVFLTVSTNASAQTAQWIKQMGTGGISNGVSSDAAGNVYATGTISNPGLFDDIRIPLGVSTSNTVSLAVTAPNILPVAKFIVTPPTGPAPLDVVLTSDGSYDPDGAIGNRQWNFSDGGDYFGNTAYHTFSGAGTFTVKLTVFDDRGAKGVRTQTVVVF
jgi:PKD repeat protein